MSEELVGAARLVQSVVPCGAVWCQGCVIGGWDGPVGLGSTLAAQTTQKMVLVIDDQSARLPDKICFVRRNGSKLLSASPFVVAVSNFNMQQKKRKQPIENAMTLYKENTSHPPGLFATIIHGMSTVLYCSECRVPLH